MTESKPVSIKRDGAFRLDGRHALVTGGASGIGEATRCANLRSAGAFVWIADINITAAAELAAKEVCSAQAILLDVTSEESIAAAGSAN